jgi:hypothetical protein
MSEECKILAAVTIEGLVIIGKTPAAPLYVCATSSVYFPASAPFVCSAASGSAIVGVFLQNKSAQELAKKASAAGCEVVLEVTSGVTKIAIVQGKAVSANFRNELRNSAINLRAATSDEGIIRLMNAIGR